MADFLIPRSVPKFAGTKVTALDLDDLRYPLHDSRRALRDRAQSTSGAEHRNASCNRCMITIRHPAGRKGPMGSGAIVSPVILKYN